MRGRHPKSGLPRCPLLAAAAAVLLAAGCGPPREALVVQAVRRWRGGDPQAAREMLNQHVAAHPTDREAQLLLARLAMLEGDPATALRCAEQGVDLAADSPWPSLWAAVAAHEMGRPDEARLWIDQSVAASPGFRPAHFFLGTWLLDDPSAAAAAEAELHLAQATRTRDLRPIALNNMAIALIRQGRAGEARARLEEAVRSQPGLAPAQFNLGLLLWLDADDREGARRALDSLGPVAAAPPYDRLVPGLLAQLVPPAALRMRLESAAAPPPADPAAASDPFAGAPATVRLLIDRARTAADRGDAGAAAAGWLQTGDWFRGAGQWEPARQSYESAARLQPVSPEPWGRLADVLEKAGRAAEALTAYRSMAERLRDPTPAFREAVRLALALDQKPTAVEVLLIWSQVQPSDPAPLAQLADLYAASPGQEQKAVELRRVLCDRFADHPLGQEACAQLREERPADRPEAAAARLLTLDEAGRLVQGRRTARVQVVPQTAGTGRADRDRAVRALREGARARSAGQLPDAMRNFQQAIAADPSFAEPYAGLGGAFEDLAQAEKAIEAYLLALERDPRLVAARARLATLMAGRGYYADAFAHARTVLAAEPAHAGAHFVLGQALARVSQAEALAAEQFRRAVAGGLPARQREEAEKWLATHPAR